MSAADTKWLDEAPDATWLDEAPDAAPEVAPPPPPSVVARAAKAIGETGADVATSFTDLAAPVLDPAMSAVGAAGSYLVPGTGEGSPLDRFRNEMDLRRRARAEAHERSPTASLVASVAPVAIAPQLLARIPAPYSAAAPAGAGALPFLGRAAAGTADAALFNAASAAGTNIDRPGVAVERVGEALSSPANLVGAGPAVLSEAARIPARDAMAWAARKFLPEVKPTAAAQRMRAQGVPLTTGQLDPDSFIGHLEEVSAQSLKGMGREREAALGSAREIAANKGLAPGAKPVRGEDMHTTQAKIYEGFEPAYDAIRGEQIYPAVHGKGVPLQSTAKAPGAFDLAVTDPNVPIDDTVRVTAKRFLDNQLSILPGGTTRPSMLQPVDAGDLLKMRQNIRLAAHNAEAQAAQGAVGKGDLAEILRRAEHAVTDTLGSQLSKDASQLLAKTDAAYRMHRIAGGAVARARTEGRWTPYQYKTEAMKSVGPRAWERGEGGDAQRYAEDLQKVFEERTPPTGFRKIVLSGIPDMAAGLASAGLNLPAVRASMLREPYVRPPIPATPALSPVGPSPPGPSRSALLAWLLERQGAPYRFAPASAAAEE